MFGSAFRSLPPHPFLRGGLLILALALVSLSAHFFGIHSCKVPAEPPAVASTVTDVAEADARVAWPRTVLRLWLLVPQLLPDHDR